MGAPDARFNFGSNTLQTACNKTREALPEPELVADRA